MPVEITVPRLGWSMEEGVFREWLVAAGTVVRPGDALFVLETDKAAQEVESFDGGILGIPVGAPAAGDKVAVGQLLGYLLAEGEAMPEHAPPRVLASPVAPPPPSPVVSNVPFHRSHRGRVPASPRARRKARDLGIELATAKITGTGRGGRVRERDILNSARLLGSVRAGATRAITFMTARAVATAFDAMVADIARQKGDGFSRRDLMERLLKVALSEHPELSSGEAIEIGVTFGLTDFTEGRIEIWVPEVAPDAVASLGIGRASGDPPQFPLNLSFDASRVCIEEVAALLDCLCELIEAPVLALVR